MGERFHVHTCAIDWVCVLCIPQSFWGDFVVKGREIYMDVCMYVFIYLFIYSFALFVLRHYYGTLHILPCSGMVGCLLPPDVMCLHFLGPVQQSKGIESVSKFVHA
jgi:hypothetical protein